METNWHLASEHEHQVALFQWRDKLGIREFPELRWMFAIPNGGLRHFEVAQKLKAEGVQAGVSDVFLAVARGGFHGMWIEMKRCGGKTTKKQREFLEGMVAQGYYCIVGFHWEATANEIVQYMKGEIKKWTPRNASA